jgi:hypothetical protein
MRSQVVTTGRLPATVAAGGSITRGKVTGVQLPGRAVSSTTAASGLKAAPSSRSISAPV